jgi:hypothetical protein
MEQVSNNGRNTNHFLDQFVFYDVSPQFQHWPKIEASELGEFLTGAVGLLKKLSRGYGIWNYFDYRANHLYNPNFLRGLHGWESRGGVTVRCEGESVSWVWLAPGARLGQKMVPELRGNATSLYESIKFRALATVAGVHGAIRLFTDEIVDAEVPLAPGASREVTAELRPEPHRGAGVVEFVIENSGSAPVGLTELCVWGFVYRTGLYDEEGRPGQHLQYIRTMNER